MLNITITRKRKKSDMYIPGTFWDNFIDSRDEPLIQCNVSAVKNTSLDNGDNFDGYILNILFLELILCIVLFS